MKTFKTEKYRSGVGQLLLDGYSVDVIAAAFPSWDREAIESVARDLMDRAESTQFGEKLRGAMGAAAQAEEEESSLERFRKRTEQAVKPRVSKAAEAVRAAERPRPTEAERTFAEARAVPQVSLSEKQQRRVAESIARPNLKYLRGQVSKSAADRIENEVVPASFFGAYDFRPDLLERDIRDLPKNEKEYARAFAGELARTGETIGSAMATGAEALWTVSGVGTAAKAGEAVAKPLIKRAIGAAVRPRAAAKAGAKAFVEAVKPATLPSTVARASRGIVGGELAQQAASTTGAPITEWAASSDEKAGWLKKAVKRGWLNFETAQQLKKGNIEEVARLVRAQESLEGSEEYHKAMAPKGLFASIGTFFTPEGAMAALQATIESLILSAPGMLAGYVGGRGVGKLGAMAGVGGASGAVEYAGEFLDTLRQAEIDTSDPEALARAFSDVKLYTSARNMGLRKGIPVAVFDAISAGWLEGWLGAAGSGLVRRTVQALKSVGAQGFAGGTGEALSQFATRGRITDWPGILLEVAAEAAGTPMEAVGVWAGARKDQAAAAARETIRNLVNEGMIDDPEIVDAVREYDAREAEIAPAEVAPSAPPVVPVEAAVRPETPEGTAGRGVEEKAAETAGGAKEPWEMKTGDYVRWYEQVWTKEGVRGVPADSQWAAQNHKFLVEEAAKQGKPVPIPVVDEFLANGGKLPQSGLHPDLAAKYAPPESVSGTAKPAEVKPGAVKEAWSVTRGKLEVAAEQARQEANALNARDRDYPKSADDPIVQDIVAAIRDGDMAAKSDDLSLKLRPTFERFRDHMLTKISPYLEKLEQGRPVHDSIADYPDLAAKYEKAVVTHDREDVEGLPGAVEAREGAVEAEPVEGRGREAARAGGVVQRAAEAGKVATVEARPFISRARATEKLTVDDVRGEAKKRGYTDERTINTLERAAETGFLLSDKHLNDVLDRADKLRELDIDPFVAMTEAMRSIEPTPVKSFAKREEAPSAEPKPSRPAVPPTPAPPSSPPAARPVEAGAKAEMTRDDWSSLSQTLYEENKKARSVGKRIVAANAEVRDLQARIAETKRTGQRNGWQPGTKKELANLESQLQEVQVAARPGESLNEARERYASGRWSSYNRGLDDWTLEMAQYIRDRALSEGKPVPPEVLADYPDLAPPPKPAARPVEAVAEAGSPVGPLFEKWDKAKARNSAAMTKDLDALEKRGYDTSDVRNALDDYKKIDRKDFDMAEDFAAEREAAWDDAVGAIESVEKYEAAPPPKPVARPVEAGAKTVRFGEYFTGQNGIKYRMGDVDPDGTVHAAETIADIDIPKDWPSLDAFTKETGYTYDATRAEKPDVPTETVEGLHRFIGGDRTPQGEMRWRTPTEHKTLSMIWRIRDELGRARSMKDALDTEYYMGRYDDELKPIIEEFARLSGVKLEPVAKVKGPVKPRATPVLGEKVPTTPETSAIIQGGEEIGKVPTVSEQAVPAAGGEREPGGTRGAGARGVEGEVRPELKTIRAERTREADTSVVPGDLVPNLAPHQVQGSALAIRAIDAGIAEGGNWQARKNAGGFLLADGTGAGKTRTILTVAEKYRRDGRPVVIVAPAEVIKPNWSKRTIAGSYADDSAALGIDVTLFKEGTVQPGKIHLATYENLSKLRHKLPPETILVFDEAHYLKNVGDSRRAVIGTELAGEASGVVFATATPADKVLHLEYLARAGALEGKGKTQAFKDLGLKTRKIRKGRGNEITIWEVDPAVGTEEVLRRMDALFGRLTERGQMIKREIGMDGVTVEFHGVELPEEAHQVMRRIESGFTDGGSLEDAKGLLKARILMHQRRQQEPYKIALAADMVEQDLAEGRQPIVFLSRVNYSETGRDIKEISATGEYEIIGRETFAESEGTAKLLREELERRGITDISELHGESDTKGPQAMEDFQSGRKRVMIATIESGGTGVNLDDRSGSKPRSLIVMTAPFSAVQNVQAAGRVWRMTTKSHPLIRYIFADTDVDGWNARIIGSKMKTLGAAVQGEVGRLDIQYPETYSEADYGRATERPQAGGVTAPTEGAGQIVVTGKRTYDARNDLKALGGKWSPGQQAWRVPAEKADELARVADQYRLTTKAEGGAEPPTPTPSGVTGQDVQAIVDAAHRYLEPGNRRVSVATNEGPWYFSNADDIRVSPDGRAVQARMGKEWLALTEPGAEGLAEQVGLRVTPYPERTAKTPAPEPTAPPTGEAAVGQEALRASAETLATKAEAKHPVIVQIGEEVATLVGERFETPGVKTAQSMLDKIARHRSLGEAGYGPEQVNDHVRGTVVIRDWTAAPKVLEALSARGFDIKVRIGTPFNELGYRGIHASIALGDGINGEIQVHTRESRTLADWSHRTYNKWRTVDDLEALAKENPERFREYQADTKESRETWEDYWKKIPSDIKDSISPFDKGAMSNTASALIGPELTQAPFSKTTGPSSRNQSNLPSGNLETRPDSLESVTSIPATPHEDYTTFESKQAGEAAVEYRNFPIDQIVLDEAAYQPREGLNPEHVQYLVDNWDRTKLEPLLINMENGKPFLVSGHHRLEAGRRVGDKSLPTKVIQVPREEAIRIAEASNETRLALDATERANVYQRRLDSGQNVNEIAKEFGTNANNVRKHALLTRLAPEIQVAMREKNTPLTFERAVKLAEATQRYNLAPEVQGQAMRKFIFQRDLTPNELERVLNYLGPQAAKVKQGELFDISEGFTGALDQITKLRRDLKRMQGNASRTAKDIADLRNRGEKITSGLAVSQAALEAHAENLKQKIIDIERNLAMQSKVTKREAVSEKAPEVKTEATGQEALTVEPKAGEEAHPKIPLPAGELRMEPTGRIAPEPGQAAMFEESPEVTAQRQEILRLRESLEAAQDNPNAAQMVPQYEERLRQAEGKLRELETGADKQTVVEALDAAADAVMDRYKRRKLEEGGLRAAPDPRDVGDAVAWTALKIAKGAVKGAEWVKEAVDTFGEWIRPHLDAIWAKAETLDEAEMRDLLREPKVEEPGPTSGMSTAGRVRAEALPGVADTQAVVEHAGNLADWLYRAREEMTNLFNPAGASEDAGLMGRLAREQSGRLKREQAAIKAQRAKVEREVARLLPSDAERIDFMNRMDQGQPQRTPRLQHFADEYRQMLEEAWGSVKAIYPELGYIQNYFPRAVFKDGGAAFDFIERILATDDPGGVVMKRGRRTYRLSAGTGFTKQRMNKMSFVEWVNALQDAGFKLRETNPERIVQAARVQAVRFILGHDIIGKAADAGLIVPIVEGRATRAGAIRLNEEVVTLIGRDKLVEAAQKTVADRAQFDMMAQNGDRAGLEENIRRYWKLRPNFTFTAGEAIANPRVMSSIRGAEKAGVIEQVTAKSPKQWLAIANVDDLARYARHNAERAMVESAEAGKLGLGAQEDVARVLNNHLSGSWRGNPFFDAAMGLNNLTLTFRFGFSPFHMVVTGLVSSATTMETGLRRLFVTEQRLAGAKQFVSGASVLPALARNLATGAWSRRQYLSTAPLEAEAALEPYRARLEKGEITQGQFDQARGRLMGLEAGTKAGLTLAPGEEYRLAGDYQRMVEHLRNKRLISAAANVPGAAAQGISKVIFDYWVPVLKGAAVNTMAEPYRIQLENGRITQAQFDRLMARAVDSMENRFGQINYDNLLWHRKTKGIAQLLISAVGWRGGTLREFGGAGKDLAEQVTARLTGRYHDLPIEVRGLTPRQSFLISELMMTATLSATLMFIATGEWPDELKDLIFPKVGKDDQGRDIRIRIPGYTAKDLADWTKAFWTKDWADILRAPIEWTGSGLSPAVTTPLEIGNSILEARPGSILSEMAAEAARSPMPIIAGTLKRTFEQAPRLGTAAKVILPMTSRAKRWQENTPAETMLDRLTVKVEGYDKKVAAEKRKLREAVRGGKLTDEMKAKAEADEIVSERGWPQFKRYATMTAPERMVDDFKKLKSWDQEKVYDLANAEEKKLIGEYRKSKGWEAGESSDEEKPKRSKPTRPRSAPRRYRL